MVTSVIMGPSTRSNNWSDYSLDEESFERVLAANGEK